MNKVISICIPIASGFMLGWVGPIIYEMKPACIRNIDMPSWPV
jgi:hypothetical protein